MLRLSLNRQSEILGVGFDMGVENYEYASLHLIYSRDKMSCLSNRLNFQRCHLRYINNIYVKIGFQKVCFYL